MVLATPARARLFFFACLALAMYFAYTALLGAVRSERLAGDRSTAAERVAALEEKKAYLEGVRAYVATDAYVEQEARRQLGYTRDGEIPFAVISPAIPLSDSSGDGAPAGEWWERLFPR